MKNLIDIHTHSVLSLHAFSSLTENIEQAHKIGLKVYGISEHQYDNVGVGAHFYASNNTRVFPDYYEGMRVLKGIELNILDGHFDADKIRIEELDYCIASMHGYVYSSKHTSKENTDNYIMACNTDYIKIIGHMDSSVYPCDYEAVILEAIKNNKLIELNNASLDPRGCRPGARENDKKILSLCAKHNCPIVVNSDAHIKYDVGNMESAFALLEEVNFPDELVVNYDLDLLNKYIKLEK